MVTQVLGKHFFQLFLFLGFLIDTEVKKSSYVALRCFNHNVRMAFEASVKILLIWPCCTENISSCHLQGLEQLQKGTSIACLTSFVQRVHNNVILPSSTIMISVSSNFVSDEVRFEPFLSL